jgi:HPr kinase/phosphorylase
LPPSEALQISISGVEIPRIPVGEGVSPLPLVVAALTTSDGLPSLNDRPDCFKGIGNHIPSTLATE